MMKESPNILNFTSVQLIYTQQTKQQISETINVWKSCKNGLEIYFITCSRDKTKLHLVTNEQVK